MTELAYSSALANVIYQAGHQTWWAQVRALASTNPDERHPFCNWPRRGLVDTNKFDYAVAEDEAHSIEDDVEEFHQDCGGIANESF